VRGLKDEEKARMAAAGAVYEGSSKHKHGVSWLGVGTPGKGALTIEEAVREEPDPPFTMICPIKWNRRDPLKEATDLLRDAIAKGQVGHPIEGGLPYVVWARDPECATIVYRVRRLSSTSNQYKAYPLTRAEVLRIGIDVS